MMEPMEANPLGLSLENGGLLHQLRLTWQEGLDATRRTNLCTLVLEHLAATEGTFFFNTHARYRQS